jgi:hypothetical protein
MEVHMKRSGALVSGLFAALLLVGFSQRLAADVIFFSGDLETNGNVLNCGQACTLNPASNSIYDYATWAASVYTFDVTNTTTMEAITYGYGGGTSLTGAVVAAGGLEPYLSLFDANGNFLASTYSGTTCPAGANTVNGNCYDVSLDGGTLNPGTYQIAITDYANMSVAENSGAPYTLSDGFTGLGGLQSGESLSYAFDVILPSDVAVPEPGTLRFMAIGAAGLLTALWRRRRQ